jgi:hypothetical protein
MRRWADAGIAGRVALGVAATACSGLAFHTAWALASYFVPVPWADIGVEHSWIASCGVTFSGLFRPYNDHVLAVPRIFILIDYFAFGASTKLLVVLNFLLAVGIVSVLCAVAAKWFFVQRQDAAWYACLLVATYVNGLSFLNLAMGFQIQHWLAVLSCCLFASLFAGVRPTTRGGLVCNHLAMIALAACAVFSLGNGILCLATAVVVSVAFRFEKSRVLFFVTLLVGLACLFFWCNPHAGFQSVGGAWSEPWRLARFALAFLGGPGLRAEIWPPDPVVSAFRANLATLRGSLVFALGAILCVREWRARAARTAFSTFHVFLTVFVWASAMAVALTRMHLGVFEGLSVKYTCTALVGWIAAFSLLLKQLSLRWSIGRWRRDALWAAAVGAVLLFVLPPHRREIEMFRDQNNVLLEVESALFAGVEEQHLEILGQDFDVFQNHFRPERRSIFGRYAFSLGDALVDHFSLQGDRPCAGRLETAEPTTREAAVIGCRVSGWAWDGKRKAPFSDLLLVDAIRRIRGVAHSHYYRHEASRNAADPRRGRATWVGYAEPGDCEALTVYAVIPGSNAACPLSER